MDHLSPRQEQIMTCIREWIFEHGEAPTFREIVARTTAVAAPPELS
ncbi:LexA family protein [Streptomyces sp. NPDC055709]